MLVCLLHMARLSRTFPPSPSLGRPLYHWEGGVRVSVLISTEPRVSMLQMPCWVWAGGACGWVAGRAGYWVFCHFGVGFVVSAPRLLGTQLPFVTWASKLFNRVRRTLTKKKFAEPR